METRVSRAGRRQRHRIVTALATTLATALAVAGLVAVLSQGPPPAKAAAGTSVLGPNETLSPGQSITSANRFMYLMMQTDGNLVLYGFDQGWNVLWASNTMGNPGATLTVQDDGNLVLYATDRRPLWATNTMGNPGATLLAQDDGNLVLYAPGGRPLWQTNTTLRKLITLLDATAQPDEATSCPPPPTDDQPTGCERPG